MATDEQYESMKVYPFIGVPATSHGIANPVLNQGSQLKLTATLALAVNPFPMGFIDSDPDSNPGRTGQRR